MPKLTLCMIVKNEEDVLARCLGSVTGKNPQPDHAGDAPKTRTERSACPIDEIVVADTGSTDGTKRSPLRSAQKSTISPGTTIFPPRGIFLFPKRRAIIFYGSTPTITSTKPTVSGFTN